MLKQTLNMGLSRPIQWSGSKPLSFKAEEKMQVVYKWNVYTCITSLLIRVLLNSYGSVLIFKVHV